MKPIGNNEGPIMLVQLLITLNIFYFLINNIRMAELVAFIILTVAILGAICGNKDFDNLAVKNSIPVALYWKQGKVPYEISQAFGTNTTIFFNLK